MNDCEFTSWTRYVCLAVLFFRLCGYVITRNILNNWCLCDTGPKGFQWTRVAFRCAGKAPLLLHVPCIFNAPVIREPREEVRTPKRSEQISRVRKLNNYTLFRGAYVLVHTLYSLARFRMHRIGSTSINPGQYGWWCASRRLHILISPLCLGHCQADRRHMSALLL